VVEGVWAGDKTWLALAALLLLGLEWERRRNGLPSSLCFFVVND